MGVAIEEIVHIGDRDHNDVKGPQALGMKAILFTATRAADKDRTTADAICERHADLVATVDRLAKGA
jgi:putative hydrolase of the HAD superfamily